jgi:hypothetical protein
MAIDKTTLQRMRTGHRLTIKRFVQNIINIYKDNWSYIILEELNRQVSKETFDSLKFLTSQELNVLKRVVNELSVVYKNPAQRTAILENDLTVEDGDINVNPIELEMYQEIISKTNKDEALKAVNQYTNLTNNVMLKPTWRNNKLEYDLYLFNNIEIYTNPEDWKEIVAVKYYNGLDVEADNYYTGGSYFGLNSASYLPSMKVEADKGFGGELIQGYYSAVVWVKEDIGNCGIIEDNGSTKTLEGGKIYTVKTTKDCEYVSEVEDIPYLDEEGKPILPFVLYNRVYPVDSLLNFTVGNDLRDLTVNVAILLIYLNTVEKYQSFKQLVFNTDDPESIPSNVKTGPTDVIVNYTKEGSGSVEVLDLQTDIKAKYEIIKERIVNVLAGYGISPQNFTMSGSPTSGFALKISNIGKIESREAQLSLYRNKEQELFNIERIVWNYHNPTNKLDENAKLMVDFAEMKFPKSPDEQITKDEFDLRHNVKTEIDLIIRDNPDLTKEQAEVLYQENKTVNQANAPQPIQLNTLQQPGGTNALQQEEEER